jgi:S1-C subfamily serine protease
VTTVDWVAVAFIALMALVGFRRGLIAGALSAAGVLVGALLGARLAPQLLSGGSRSPYTPLAALAGATLLALLFEAIGGVVGSWLRAGLRIPPLRTIDSFGGLLLGALTGAVVVWVLGAVALQLPNQTGLRRGAQRSAVLRRLNGTVSPQRLLHALSRVDPLPAIAGPLAPIERPDPRVLRDPVVRQAARSVVRVLGTACGLAVEGTGWVGAPGLVVTAAHVVAGQDDTTVETFGSARRLAARPVAFDSRNDVAVLRVPGLAARSLPIGSPDAGRAVAILGYPQNGPFTAVAGRLGRTTVVLAEDATGRHRVIRTVTTLAGRVRSGNSGSPGVDARGRVATTVFAARARTGSGGYGVPPNRVRDALRNAAAGRTVATGDCAD